jgi:sugar phosphate isomerase/epimerase
VITDDATIGLSTGWDSRLRGDWPGSLTAAARFGAAVELSALAADELPGLIAFLAGRTEVAAPGSATSFRYVSVHGPAKGVTDWKAVAGQLELVPAFVQTIVLHPDTFADECVQPLRVIGARLCLENMDCRKHRARSADELAAFFETFPEAGFCLDVAHAWTVDSTLAGGHELLDRYGDRLRQIHTSGIDEDGHHRPTTKADLDRYAPLLERCRHVPWIFESPLTGFRS